MNVIVKRQLCWVLFLLLLGLEPRLAAADANYAKRYASSADLREFVDQRGSSPRDGSFFYSYWARWECLDDAGVARHIAQRVQPAAGSAQGQSTRIQLERCRNLSAAESAAPLQRDDVMTGRAAGDRLFGAFHGADGSWFSVNVPADLSRAFGFLAPTEDPNIVWVVSQKLAGLAAAGRLTLQGKKLSEAEGRSLYLAFLLAACDLNVDCGPSHRWMRTWCIQNAECEDPNIESYWRRRDVNEQRMDWQAIERYRTLVVSAARSSDWSPFALNSAR